MRHKYKKFLKAAYIDYDEDYCGSGSGTFTRPAVTTPIIVFIGATATIACAISGATIYYTLDGSTPTSSSTLYTGAITLTLSCTIKAIAVKPGLTDSAVASESYIHYLTTWRLVGNSSVQTDPYLTSWKITGKSSQQEYLTQWKVEGNSYVYTETYPDDVVLPNGYKRCKYLEFHGTEYINSGIVNRSDIGFSLDLSTTSDGKTIIGARSSINDGVVFGCNYVEDNTNYTPIAYGSYTIGYANQTIIADGSRHNIVLDWQQAKIDSDSFGINRGDTFPQLSIYIGTWNDNNVPDSRMFVGKIYSVVLYCNDGNLFYGIPCLDNNNVPCLYDAVSGTSFYNAGTGTFGYEEWSLLVEIRSCGDYSAVDNKYHVKIESNRNVCDIALDEPLRKVGNVADSIEFPSDTEGKALVTRPLKIVDWSDVKVVKGSSPVTYFVLYDSGIKIATNNILSAVYPTYSYNSSPANFGGLGVASHGTGAIIRIVNESMNDLTADQFKAANADVELIYELATPTTEFVDVPQMYASENGHYISKNTTRHSAFTYAAPQIYSCGDYSDVDGKYHVKISNGVTVYDITLNEPLRRISTYEDTIEFPSGTDGKALVTRKVKQIIMSSLLWVQDVTNVSGSYRYFAEASDAKSFAESANIRGWNNGGYRIVKGNRVGINTRAYRAIGMYPTYQESQAPHFVIYDPNYDKQEDLNALLTYLEDKTLIYALATPTTELVDVSPFPVSPTDTYTSVNTVSFYKFEYTKNKSVWSCGEYNPIDGKYHILVQPLGGSIADIALDEPLRKVNDVVDTIEFPSDTEDKALVTRNLNTKHYNSLIASRMDSENKSCNLSQTLPDDSFNYTESAVANIIFLCDKLNSYSLYYGRKADLSIIPFYKGLFIRNASIEQTTEAYQEYLNGLGAIDIIYKLATPTTELVDAPQIEEAESYTCVITPGAKVLSWSSFETE